MLGIILPVDGHNILPDIFIGELFTWDCSICVVAVFIVLAFIRIEVIFRIAITTLRLHNMRLWTLWTL